MFLVIQFAKNLSFQFLITKNYNLIISLSGFTYEKQLLYFKKKTSKQLQKDFVIKLNKNIYVRKIINNLNLVFQ